MGRIIYLLYIDDLKIYSATQSKLDRVMKATKRARENVGLVWNQKRCSVAHVKCRLLSIAQGDTVIGEVQIIKAPKEGEIYKFLGVLENLKQEDELVLCGTSKVYLKTIIWTSPLLDCHKVIAPNQYALPILAYAMCT